MIVEKDIKINKEEVNSIIDFSVYRKDGDEEIIINSIQIQVEEDKYIYLPMPLTLNIFKMEIETIKESCSMSYFSARQRDLIDRCDIYDKE